MLTRILLVSCVALFLGGPASAADDHEYVGVKKCASCHKKEKIGNQLGKWEESKHSKAYETLAGDKAKEIATKKGIADPQKADECLECHTTAFGVDKSRLGSKFDIAEGVACEACHGAGGDYRKKKVMMDQDKAIAAGLVIPDEKTCTGCHNDRSPTWDPAEGFDFEKRKEDIAHPVPEGYDAGGDEGDDEE